MDDPLLKHLPPYQLMLYKNYTPSSTGASFEEFSLLSSTNTNNNDASSLLSSSAAESIGSSSHKQIGTDNFWFQRLRMNGQRLGAKSSIPLMKNFWENEAEKERIEAEKCNQRHKLQRPYDFPRWRSSDAFSASLVASAKTLNMIPVDSRMPQNRISKIHENEIRAEETKKLIQQTAASERPIRRTNFNNTMCLLPEDFGNKQEWYNHEQIRSSIENDSIANISQTRAYFEQASRAADFENQLIPRPFVADRAVLSPVPLNQNLSVQCQQQNFSPNTQFSSPSQNSQHNNNYNQNIYSQPQQNGIIMNNFAQQETKMDEALNRPMTFLEKEILEVAKREQEHRLQQQRNGHLTLEETFDLWRNGSDWNPVISRQSSSGFHDFDNHDSGVENMTTSSQ